MTTPNPPAALTAAPQQLGKKKLPYTKPYVEHLTTPSVTHGKVIDIPNEATGGGAAYAGPS